MACWQAPAQPSCPAAAALPGAMVTVSGTWPTTGANALLAGLIGVAATLPGSFTTYLSPEPPPSAPSHSSATSDHGTDR